MSTLAEIEHALETLSPADQEALLRLLARRFDMKHRAHSPYRLKTRPGNVLPGIDPDRLGQVPEDF